MEAVGDNCGWGWCGIDYPIYLAEYVGRPMSALSSLKTRISHGWKGRVPVFSSSSCFSWDLVQLLQIKFSLFYNATDDKLLKTYLCFNLITQILVPVPSRICLETLGGLDAGCLAGCSRLPSGQSATTLVYAGSELGSATDESIWQAAGRILVAASPV